MSTGHLAPGHATPGRTGTTPGQSSATVLLIDDDRSYLEMVTLKLELEGHTVITATDGAAGLEMASRQLPDIIFLDIVLPVLDGLAVLNRLKADSTTRDIPVVVVSGRCERQLIAECRRSGAIDFLVKSMSVPATLNSAVRNFARQRSGGA